MNALVATEQRLQGDWRVTAFTPESALEAPLQGLLNAQLGGMTVSFTGPQYRATGPGLDIQSRVELKTSGNDLFDGVLYDSTGVGYRVSGQFEGATVRFRSYESAWRGTGTLQRP